METNGVDLPFLPQPVLSPNAALKMEVLETPPKVSAAEPSPEIPLRSGRVDVASEGGLLGHLVVGQMSGPLDMGVLKRFDEAKILGGT
ncbi:MAG TPA: hypothetical protein VFC51_20205 [Chloroflexota bacterium]|nr:hypothetical protein [Chloroflexota bacterium]